MADTTLGGVTLQDLDQANIEENTARKEAILTPMPLYSQDSSQTDVFDFGGVIKTITLIGSYAGTSVANCKTFIDSVEALIQGQQDRAAGYPITFTDDLRGTLKVKVMDFESTLASGNFKCTWTLKIVESSENA